MPEQVAFATDGDDRVAILHAGVATVEIASPRHAELVDEIEGVPRARRSPAAPRIAIEVEDTDRTVAATTRAGVDLLAPPTRTPFRSLNARVQGPAGWQVTLFQELETLEQRRRHVGFTIDEVRDR